MCLKPFISLPSVKLNQSNPEASSSQHFILDLDHFSWVPESLPHQSKTASRKLFLVLVCSSQLGNKSPDGSFISTAVALILSWRYALSFFMWPPRTLPSKTCLYLWEALLFLSLMASWMLSGCSPCRRVSSMTGFLTWTWHMLARGWRNATTPHPWHSVGGAWEFSDLLKTWTGNLNKVNELLQAISLCFV